MMPSSGKELEKPPNCSCPIPMPLLPPGEQYLFHPLQSLESFGVLPADNWLFSESLFPSLSLRKHVASHLSFLAGSHPSCPKVSQGYPCVRVLNALSLKSSWTLLRPTSWTYYVRALRVSTNIWTSVSQHGCYWHLGRNFFSLCKMFLHIGRCLTSLAPAN